MPEQQCQAPHAPALSSWRFPRAQLNLEFLLVLLFALLFFTSLFALYSSQAAGLRRSSLMDETELGAKALGSAINSLAAAGNAESAGLLLPSGSYSLSVKGRRVRAAPAGSPSSEFSYPLIAPASFAGGPSASGGDLLKLEKKNGVVHVSVSKAE